MKKLNDILYKAACVSVKGSTDMEISRLSFDSRTVEKGTLFIAVKGNEVDGHHYIEKAIENGASAILCETLPENCKDGLAYVVVKDSKEALGIVASNFYDNPSELIKLIGITGTNGKTTTVTLLYQLFLKLGYNAGMISTICIAIGQTKIETSHTTPDAITLNKVLHDMVQEGVTHCFMEVSSHAVVQKRISGLYFTGAVFSNITHDHLDYHNTFSEYLKAKKKFFDDLNKSAFALTNIDDPNGLIVLQNTKAKKQTYGIKKMGDFKCKIIENSFDGINLQFFSHNVWFKLIGAFNAYNLLTSFAVALLLGENDSQVLRALSSLYPVEGRFQHFKSQSQITAVVDYAHTPDALKNVLETIKAIRTGNEKLITVIGCGGNRDKAKRPLMAEIAVQYSNTVILTSDNPRHEEPQNIIDEMMAGIDTVSKRKTLCVPDRKEAIKTATVMAQSGDIILVAGKGHEKYQEIKGVKYPFDDLSVLKEFLLI